LAKAGVKVEEEYAKDVLINSFPSNYSNVTFTLDQLPSQFLKIVMFSLMVEEK
jgi:hypothetical protein